MYLLIENPFLPVNAATLRVPSPKTGLELVIAREKSGWTVVSLVQGPGHFAFALSS